MKKITLIKLGGSIITDKSKPETIRYKVLENLVEQIKKYQLQSNEVILIGHGAGSFGHMPAKLYKTMDGFIHRQSKKGMVITQDAVARLNRTVVGKLIEAGLPAVTFAMSQNSIAENKKPYLVNTKVLNHYLENNLIPVTYGDVISDKKNGCTIWSTEKIFSILTNELKNKFEISRVIHVTDVKGFLDKNGNLIDQIESNNFDQLEDKQKCTNGADVTGGMYHKIEESIKLGQEGTNSYIISGLVKNNLLHCLSQDNFVGTTIN